ncbi:hypothetical protein M407DRAFT_19124 [Tulasnella calospora MUT 4182]|uniref:Homeobox domain-containing protein n=1 Tax=Tulasnella calospora MUT 4182 TaxID=1051891 RepID=A0A0C3QSE7_9AGAM|nr:hypothetical protein M407DRAFT_19124 [Tulasnella calospora MUT 4182]
MSSSTDPSSPAPSTPSDEHLQLPHIRPISHPRSPDDFVIYEELTVFEKHLLLFDQTHDEYALQQLEHHWQILESRAVSLNQQGKLGDETKELLQYVIDSVEAMLESFQENDADYQTVSSSLTTAIRSVFEEEAREAQANKPKKIKVSHSPVPLPKKTKPQLQIKRLPIDFPKTHRKRRVESGIPGQESLKFRPCRDFFMENLSDPYPTASQKQDLQARAGINATSLNQWFTNTRRRSGWMDIMKNYANNRKDEMKNLVEGVLFNSHYPAGQEVKEAITKMRKYVDELAREVVSNDFMNDLTGLLNMTDADALRWHEDQRQRRKKIAQIKRECQTPQLCREDSNTRTGEKRKREADEDPIPSKLSRTSTWSASPRALKAVPSASTIDVQARRTPTQHRATPSLSRDSIPTTQSDARMSVEAASEDEIHIPPKDLSRRRLGVPDLSAPHRTVGIPLSAASTLVGSELGEAPSTVYHKSSPSSYGRPRSGSETQPSSEADYEATADSPVVSVTVPKVQASIDPNDIPFSLREILGLDEPKHLTVEGWVNGVRQAVHSASFVPTLPSLGPDDPAAFWSDIVETSSLSYSAESATNFNSPVPVQADAPVVTTGEACQDVVIPMSSLPEGALAQFHALSVNQMQQFDPYAAPPSDPSNSHPSHSYDGTTAYTNQAFTFVDQPHQFSSTPVPSTISFGPPLEASSYEYGQVSDIVGYDPTALPLPTKQESFVQHWDSSATPQIVYPDTGAPSAPSQEWTIPQPVYYSG